MGTPVVVQFKQWEFLVDVEATRTAYAERHQGDPERCGCLYCRNFAAARDKVYTPEVVAFLVRFGVSPIREAETWGGGYEIRSGVQSYGGIFHVVGQMRSGPDPKSEKGVATLQFAEVTSAFGVLFTRKVELVPDCFPKSGLFQIEFNAEVPWVLPEPWELST